MTASSPAAHPSCLLPHPSAQLPTHSPVRQAGLPLHILVAVAGPGLQEAVQRGGEHRLYLQQRQQGGER